MMKDKSSERFRVPWPKIDRFRLFPVDFLKNRGMCPEPVLLRRGCAHLMELDEQDSFSTGSQLLERIRHAAISKLPDPRCNGRRIICVTCNAKHSGGN